MYRHSSVQKYTTIMAGRYFFTHIYNMHLMSLQYLILSKHKP